VKSDGLYNYSIYDMQKQIGWLPSRAPVFFVIQDDEKEVSSWSVYDLLSVVRVYLDRVLILLYRSIYTHSQRLAMTLVVGMIVFCMRFVLYAETQNC
jgi:hypothetical protein